MMGDERLKSAEIDFRVEEPVSWAMQSQIRITGMSSWSSCFDVLTLIRLPKGEAEIRMANAKRRCGGTETGRMSRDWLITLQPQGLYV